MLGRCWRNVEDLTPGRAHRGPTKVDGIEPIPRRVQPDEARSGRRSERRKAFAHPFGTVEHLRQRKPARRHQNRTKHQELRVRQSADAVERQIGHYDVAGDTAQPPDGLLDPFEGLRGRKAIEDVVADIRDEASSRHLRARLEGGPETRLENARQPAKEDATVRSIGPTMTKGCQDLDLRAPRGSSARDDCWKPQRQVAGAECNDSTDVGRLAPMAARPYGFSCHQLNNLASGFQYR